jgi:phospho-N-acetylmuramoyl-pentapeptide-transferase
MKAILLGGGLALLISLLGTRYAIRSLTRRGYGQEIREDGPTTHHLKRGTPTMGGIVIIIATVVGYAGAHVLVWDGPTASAMLLLGLFVALGLVGFIDDFIKIVMQRNLGLRSASKLIGQTLVAVAFAALALWDGLADSNGLTPASHHVSFIRDFTAITLPTVVVVFVIWLWVTGFSNAVNLTDGLDGLATGASVMVYAAYTLINIWQNNQSCSSLLLGTVDQDTQNQLLTTCYQVRDPLDLAVVTASITGACFGFLWWNAPPARIFMGDTGSLALGGALAGLAVLTRTEFLLVILGGIFVLELLSVVAQVGFFKASGGKRILRMAPLHHHFEMLGWEQVTVVIRFWIITGLTVAVGVGVFYAEWVAST